MRLSGIWLESIASQNIRITTYDEDGWDTDYDPNVAADQADRIAHESGIRIASNKQLAHIAMDGDNVIGAVWSARYSDADQEADVYDFDMAIDQHYRNQVAVFLQLMKAAMNDYRYLRSDNPRTYISVWVVNPRLADVLERRYGFERDDLGHGHARMAYYGD